MKVLSLMQPWASLIYAWVKTSETRYWMPSKALSPGDRFAIHAARTLVDEGMPACYDETMTDLFGGDWRDTIPRGMVICTVEFVDAFKVLAHDSDSAGDYAVGVSRFTGKEVRLKMDGWGNYEEDRSVWLLDNVKPLAEPIPLRGQPGLFNWEPPFLDTQENDVPEQYRGQPRLFDTPTAVAQGRQALH